MTMTFSFYVKSSMIHKHILFKSQVLRVGVDDTMWLTADHIRSIDFETVLCRLRTVI